MKIDIDTKAGADPIGIKGVAFLQAAAALGEGTAVEIRDRMMNTLKRPVDTAAVYLSITRLGKRKMVRTVKGKGTTRVVVEKKGQDALADALDMMSKLVRAAK